MLSQSATVRRDSDGKHHNYHSKKTGIKVELEHTMSMTKVVSLVQKHADKIHFKQTILMINNPAPQNKQM